MEKRSKYKLKVAVVILNYNGKLHLQNYLQSVLNHIPALAQLYIADNGSDDGSVRFLEDNFPDIHLIKLDKNSGYAGGYNKALKLINAEYYFLLNSDVELTNEGLTTMVDFLDNNPEYVACQPKVRSLIRRDEFEYAGACGGWLDWLGYPFCRGRILGTNEKDHGQYDQIEKIFWATGAALLIRSDEFHFVGGFDEDFFAHMEEIDLSWRLQRMGKHIAVIPCSVIYHLGGGTLDYSSPRKTFLNFRNSLFILLKNERGHILWRVLALRFLLDGVAALRFIILGDVGNFLAVWKAHMHFYKSFSVMWEKRKKYLQLLQNNNIQERIALDGRYTGSVVWDYYILGKKRLNELNIDEKREKQISKNL